MAKSQNQKAKILYLAKMLLELTDDDHGLTMNQILARLADAGISAEHKSIYSDMDTLRGLGLDIVKRGSARNTEYAIGERDFRYEELMMLVVAVESSKFLTHDMSSSLIDKLKTLTSAPSAAQLQGCIQSCSGPHMSNRHAFYHLHTIIDAIENGHQISFVYTHRTLRGFEERGAQRTATPICVLYSEGNCYVATYNQEKDDIYMYRIDHMADVCELEAEAVRCEKTDAFDAERFALQSFGMFSGDVRTVTLLVHESCLNAVYDRFGTAELKVINVPDAWAQGKWARVVVDVIPSPPFYGWVAGFNGNVMIEHPTQVVEAYKQQLQHALEGPQALRAQE